MQSLMFRVKENKSCKTTRNGSPELGGESFISKMHKNIHRSTHELGDPNAAY